MSTHDEFTNMIEQLYSLDRILTAMQKKPHAYSGVSLHSTEAHTLKMIALNQGISQAELSDRMLRTKGATSVMVDKLVEKSLVCRERVGDDQRRYLLTLTEKGEAVHAAHLTYDSLHMQKLGRELNLPEEDLATTCRTLEKLIGYYSRNYLDHGKAVTPQL